MNEFLTIKEICQVLKISRQTVYNMFKSGLNYYKIQGSIRIKKEDLETFISKGRRGKNDRTKKG